LIAGLAISAARAGPEARPISAALVPAWDGAPAGSP
jgi:hypothetical protein